jgi:DNA-binding MarR family transcriptional regulator
MHALFDKIHGVWANRIGVTIPQLTLMLALRDNDSKGTGLPVKEVARILGVDPAFATTQSKILEAKEFIDRKPSTEDGRVVYLCLSNKSLKSLTALSQHQRKINDYIFSEITEQGIQALLMKVIAIKNRMEKASALASIDLAD